MYLLQLCLPSRCRTALLLRTAYCNRRVTGDIYRPLRYIDVPDLVIIPSIRCCNIPQFVSYLLSHTSIPASTSTNQALPRFWAVCQYVGGGSTEIKEGRSALATVLVVLCCVRSVRRNTMLRSFEGGQCSCCCCLIILY